ncbi:MAG: ATP synthase subunit C [Spirochaetes bacterium]|nr:ATP synthase subunit C [Spirochaetota bacterium]
MNPTKEFKRKVMLSLVVTFAIMAMFAMGSVVNVFAQDNTPAAEMRVITEHQAQVQMFGLIAAAVAFGFGAIAAGIAIGQVGSAAMGAIAEKPEIATHALIFIALAEGLVVFGFITALMILGAI